jgi:hypothetical protein
VMMRNASRLEKVTASLDKKIEGLSMRCGMGRGGGGGCAACKTDINSGSLSDGSEGGGGGTTSSSRVRRPRAILPRPHNGRRSRRPCGEQYNPRGTAWCAESTNVAQA